MSFDGLNEVELRQLVKDLARETLERYRELNLLYRSSETIGASLDPDEVPRLLFEESERVISSDGAAFLHGESAPAPEWAQAARLIDRVRQSGRPDIASWPPVGDEEKEFVSALCVPVRTGEKVLGAVVLGRSKGRPQFTASDEKLLLGLASQAGVALARARLHEQEKLRERMDEELAVARRIQVSLLPAQLPQIPGWSFAAFYSAARQVGGDFYDFIDDGQGGHRLRFVVADVAGKGVPAALMMAYSRALLRAESMAGHEPAEVLARTNRLILGDRQARPFVSAFYADFELDTGRVTYANGGHDAPLLLTARGDCHELDAPGAILGAFDDIRLEQREVLLSRGDSLVFYTDGVTEARDPEGHFFGEQRLLAAATRAPGGAESILDAVSGAVSAFTAGAEQADDVTIVVVQRTGEVSPWKE